jgi:hypothetical protein
MQDWHRIVWSDETKINRFGSDGHQWVWKAPKEGINMHTCMPTMKHGGGSIMVWGCMSTQGVGYCCQIRGNMNGALYCQVLQSTLMRSVDYLDLDKNSFIFQHDNAPCHTSKNVLECLCELGIIVLEWPPQSPDLNPIEHLWDHLKRQLAKYGTPTSGAIDLWDRVLKEWWKIEDKTCLHLIDSLPN